MAQQMPTELAVGDSRPDGWLVGGGEMGKLVRVLDWSDTPLGPIESWPQSLRNTVGLCLASNFPISLASRMADIRAALAGGFVRAEVLNRSEDSGMLRSTRKQIRISCLQLATVGTATEGLAAP